MQGKKVLLMIEKLDLSSIIRFVNLFFWSEHWIIRKGVLFLQALPIMVRRGSIHVYSIMASQPTQPRTYPPQQ